jgi:hydroxyacylglutathione hydrolase
MLIKQFVDEGLGNSSYLLASEETGQAVLIDAERDIDRYIGVAEGLGLRLTHALDTHLHNDFLSGAREAAARVGLTIGASADAGLAFDHLPLEDRSQVALGDLLLETLATPGHTPEHVSYAVRQVERRTVAAVFTGGALIVGGAARTDLLGPEHTATLTRQLYHTLRDRLLTLPDDVAVYPTHGAGSFCAAPASAPRTTTVGQERQHNRLAQARSEAEFAALALKDLPSYPTYFQYMRETNRRGPEILGDLPVLKPLAAADVRAGLEAGVAVLDVRSPGEFVAGHIPRSYGIPLGAPLITWAGWVVPFGAPLILIAAGPDDRTEAVRQLVRIGFDDLRGYLDGGLAAWQAAGQPVAQVPVLPARRLLQAMEQGTAPTVLDVRQDAEWRAGHLPGARNVAAGDLPAIHLDLPQEAPIVVHCGHADRSTIAISLLAQRGYRALALLEGGFSGWQDAGYPVERDNIL